MLYFINFILKITKLYGPRDACNQFVEDQEQRSPGHACLFVVGSVCERRDSGSANFASNSTDSKDDDQQNLRRKSNANVIAASGPQGETQSCWLRLTAWLSG